MKLTVDLHSHSPYAGGSGKTDFNRLETVMRKKGISIYGSGDILLEKWLDEISSAFSFDSVKQMWVISDGLYLMPQTEIILTLPYLHDSSKRKLFHLVILFSNTDDITTVKTIMRKYGSKLTIGRPFITFNSAESMQEFINKVALETECALIPAHVMTPEGILGGKNPINSIKDIFGGSIEHLDAVESGLSADPQMLSAIAAENNLPVVSFSDAHSASWNKLGREFTTLYTDEISSAAVIDSIRQKRIHLTAEFPPFEGRYYLTGHRADRPGHDGKEYFIKPGTQEEESLSKTTPAIPGTQEEETWNKTAPATPGTGNTHNKCPICGKKFTSGVRDRIIQLSGNNKTAPQNFVYQIPLIEIISGLRGTGIQSKKTEKEFLEVLSHVKNESEIWTESIYDELKNKINDDILDANEKIKNNNFKIQYGFDGQYGKIIL